MTAFSNDIKTRLSPRHFKSLVLARPFKDEIILNIGCYNGWLEKFAIEEGAKEITGIDKTENILKEATRGVPQAKFVRASVEKLPFVNDSFDKVCIFEVLEHLPSRSVEAAIKEIRRVLKPKGKLIISTPKNNFLNNLLDPAWYFGHRHYKEEKIIKLFEKSGFKISLIEVRGGIFQILTLNLIYIFKWLFKKEIPFKDFLNKKREAEYLTDKNGIHTLFAIFVKES